MCTSILSIPQSCLHVRLDATPAVLSWTKKSTSPPTIGGTCTSRCYPSSRPPDKKKKKKCPLLDKSKEQGLNLSGS